MQNSIELYSKIQSAKDIQELGMSLGKSGAFGCDKSEFGIVVLMTCAAENITPLQFCRTYDIIGGKPRKKAMAASAEFIAKGAKIQWLNLGDEVKRSPSGLPISGEARAKITFEDQTLEFSFSIEQAAKCGLVKANSNWDKTPGNMLRARVCSNAIGVLCPSIYAGATDDDNYDAPVQTLNLSSESKTTIQTGSPESDFAPVKPAMTKPADVIEVASEKVPEPAAEKFTATSHESGKGLSIATVNKLMEILSGVETEAMAWFVAKSKIKPNEGIGAVSVKLAQSIFDSPEKFVAMVKGGAK